MSFEELYPHMVTVARNFISNSYSYRYEYSNELDELVNEMWIRIRNKTIDPKHVNVTCKHCLIDYVRSKTHRGRMASMSYIDEHFDIENPSEFNILDMTNAFAKLCEGLSEFHSTMARMIFLRGYNQAEVGRMYNIKRTSIYYHYRFIVEHFKSKAKQVFGEAA